MLKWSILIAGDGKCRLALFHIWWSKATKFEAFLLNISFFQLFFRTLSDHCLALTVALFYKPSWRLHKICNSFYITKFWMMVLTLFNGVTKSLTDHKRFLQFPNYLRLTITCVAFRKCQHTSGENWPFCFACKEYGKSGFFGAQIWVSWLLSFEGSGRQTVYTRSTSGLPLKRLRYNGSNELWKVMWCGRLVASNVILLIIFKLPFNLLSKQT